MPRRRSDKPRHPRRRHPTVRDISSGVGPAPVQVAASNLLDSRRRKESIDVYGFLIGEAAGALLVFPFRQCRRDPFPPLGRGTGKLTGSPRGACGSAPATFGKRLAKEKNANRRRRSADICTSPL